MKALLSAAAGACLLAGSARAASSLPDRRKSDFAISTTPPSAPDGATVTYKQLVLDQQIQDTLIVPPGSSFGTIYNFYSFLWTGQTPATRIKVGTRNGSEVCP